MLLLTLLIHLTFAIQREAKISTSYDHVTRPPRGLCIKNGILVFFGRHTRILIHAATTLPPSTYHDISHYQSLSLVLHSCLLPVLPSPRITPPRLEGLCTMFGILPFLQSTMAGAS